MTTYIPFIYVNLTALGCFAMLFLAFIASKKTPEVKSFIVMLAVCILWVGGSICMRLGVYPGITFWFYVSLVSLFTLPLLAYRFIFLFVKRKGGASKYIISIGTLILDILTVCGLILKAPVRTVNADGGIVFTYSMDWTIVLVAVCAVLYLSYMIKVFVEIVKVKGKYYPGIRYIIASCAVMIVGNMLQILPGNTFPFDTLAGIFYAILLMLALCQKHMFHLSLLISRSFVIVAGLIICAIACSLIVSPFRSLLMVTFSIPMEAAGAIVIIFFAVVLNLAWRLLNQVTDIIFVHDSDHAKLVKKFSDSVGKSLSTADITDQLIDTIKEEIPVNDIYVCVATKEGYKSFNGISKLSSAPFTVPIDSPYVKYLEERDDSYYMLSDLKRDPIYRSAWQNEKVLQKQMNVTAVFAIRNDDGIAGLLLLSDKQKGKKYTYLEMDFVSTLVSITSIAFKNAVLYEKMFKEARIDTLTNTYNYRYFTEQTEDLFKKYKKDSLALMFIDIDDFRLYNQLYGTLEGDHVLRTVADIMRQCIGENGTIYRYSGKIFAALLPHYDGRRCEKLAYAIKSKLKTFNEQPERKSIKAISVSCGICISPYLAASAKELIEHADLAVFNAKNFGKDQINQFKGSQSTDLSPAEKVAHALENVETMTSAYRENNASIHALTAAIDAKDHYTYQHSQDVAMYASALAAQIGFNDEQIAMIYEGGLLHDIGKISIPESILSKTGSLDDHEYDVMKSHVNNSIDIIRHLPNMEYVIPTVLGHHERWDGHGYPRGLKGEENPVPARCLALADTFDAMTTDRPYRKAMSDETAASVIEKEAGTQFDPKLAKVFVEMIHNGELKSMKQSPEYS